MLVMVVFFIALRWIHLSTPLIRLFLLRLILLLMFFFFQAEDGIRYLTVTGVQTCALPICPLGGVQGFAPGRLVTALLERDDHYALGIPPVVSGPIVVAAILLEIQDGDRKSTRLNSSHSQISYAVFCLKKKTCTAIVSSSSS